MIVRRIELGKDFGHCEPLAACIGYFDGLHRGHMELVKQAIASAKDKKLQSALITFDPDPWVVLKNMKNIPHLTSMEQRIQIGEAIGLDQWIIVSFTKELAQLSPSDFEKQIIQELKVQTLVCGFDYSYGHMGKGNVETLKQQSNFDVIVIDSFEYEHEKISTTRIEQALNDGNVALVHELLGHPYILEGCVKKGEHLGNVYGYPTANLQLTYNSYLPKVGVYIGYVEALGKRYKAMINIGHNPTFNYKENISIEAFLVDFKGDLYDAPIQIHLIDFIREERKFESKDALIQQLNQDVLKAKALK